MLPTALTIAGSDPSGGAGLQADLKTFLAHQVYGMAVVTALTAQNTLGVQAVQPVGADWVRQQLQPVLDDVPIGAAKIGMLADAAVVAAVAETLAGTAFPVVLDPVLVSSSGHRLLAPDAVQVLIEALLPRVDVITPNLPEAAVLLGDVPPDAWAEEHDVALLLKGGHADGDPIEDHLYLPDGFHMRVCHPRVHTRNSHGTGCTLSAALAANLAKGQPIHDAVQSAVAYVADLLDKSADHRLGQGRGPLLHGLT
jgi:hydroxymethylpyrimidine/phosphomethylpyrimidine kinase